MTRKPDIQRDAVELFMQLASQKAISEEMCESRLKASHPKKERYKNLIRVMPEFNLETLSEP